jgi:phosphatidate cytidylyltransferase
MHLKRWMTGLIALPFLIVIIVKGGLVFSSFIGIVILLAQWEYFRIVFSNRRETPVRLMMGVAYVFALLIIGTAHRHAVDLLAPIIMLNFIATGCLFVFHFQYDQRIFETAQKQIIGVLYVPLLLSCLILVRSGTGMEGCKWVFFLLSIVFAGDIGALYAGTFLGKHRLIPSVSPKKTIEGSLGGIAANLLMGSCFKILFMPHLPWAASLIFFLALGIAGQLGDLFESALKRVAHVKDSGSILPGHGGILDRADALMFAAPVAYVFKVYLFQSI